MLDYVILSGIIVMVGAATAIALRAATPLRRLLGETGNVHPHLRNSGDRHRGRHDCARRQAKFLDACQLIDTDESRGGSAAGEPSSAATSSAGRIIGPFRNLDLPSGAGSAISFGGD